MEPVADGRTLGAVAKPGEVPPATAPLPRESDAGAWREMFARLADGDASSLETLYRMAAGQIFGLALWRTGSVEDAGDVVQEVFLRLLGQSRRLGSVGNPRSWLLSLAHHVAVDTVRRRRTAVPIEEAPYLVAPEHDAARAVDASRVARHLAGLPAAQREAVYLRHYADCTFAEIGAVMKVPTFTAASRYRLGVERLRKLLEGTP